MIVVAETLDNEAGPSSTPDEEETEEDDEPELIRKTRFEFKTSQDVKEALAAIEEYYADKSSPNINLCFQMQSNLDQEIADSIKLKRSRMNQLTINSFFSTVDG